EHADLAAQASDKGNGASQSDVEDDVVSEDPAARGQSTPAPEATAEPDLREQPWQAPAVDHFDAVGEAPRQPAAASRDASPDATEPESHPQPPEPESEDPSRPLRKGWWQRRFSGT
ncbi:MAG: hypothetical protein J2P51_07395, partial [Hyphomicrobiaceae bacterium]|nr:hypothetical protein [Hyphomicrobiaceae bacterium]